MCIPYMWDFGDRDLFVRDYYAKRIMTLLSLPFFITIVLLFFIKQKLTLSKNIIIYCIVFFIIFINSILFRNSISLIILDLFIVLLPIFFYLLVYKTNYDTISFHKAFPYFLIIASFLVLVKIKLQFSYFSLLAIAYIIFLTKLNLKSLLFICFLPLILIKTLIGKSALIMLGMIVIYFFLFDKKLVSKQKKIYLLIIPSVIIIIGSIVFWETIKETGAYKNTFYFFRHADFAKLKFTDMSTSHRLYEAKQVLLSFENSNYYVKFFGKGLGATIDLSDTVDVAVTNSNKNLDKVRHIHIGFFAVLYRYGIIGVLIYFIFIRKIFLSCRKVLKNSIDYRLVFGALYLLILIFDSFISFPHMASNFMFWLIVFIIIKESENINKLNI